MPNNTIEKINIGGTPYDIQDVTSGYSQIEIDNLLQQGVIIGTVILDGNNYIIYAPNESSDAGGLDVSFAGTNLNLTNAIASVPEFTEYVIANNASLYFEQGEDSTVDSLTQNLQNIFQFAEYQADDPDNETIPKYKAKLTVDGIEYYGILYAGYAPSGYYEASIETSWPDSPSMLYLGNYNAVGNEGTWFLNSYDGDDSTHTVSLSIYTPALRSAVVFNKTDTYDVGDGDRDLLTTTPMENVKILTSNSYYTDGVTDAYAYPCWFNIDGTGSYGKWYMIDFRDDGSSTSFYGQIDDENGESVFTLEKDSVGWYIGIYRTDDESHTYKLTLYY